METYEIAGRNYTVLWHCFGNYMHKVSLEEAMSMLRTSKTNALPINTHRLGRDMKAEHLEVGFGGVPFHILKENWNVDNYRVMLNINHQTTAASAVEKAIRAYELSGERIVKLEVLNTDLKTSNDREVIRATAQLVKRNEGFTIMPLCSNCAGVVRELEESGAKAVRVMGSGIGAGSGIADRDTFEEICKSCEIPVILDGGIGKPEHARLALSLGAKGFLVNSCLFEGMAPPSVELKKFVM